MRYLAFIFLLTVGCATRDELASLKQSLRTTDATVAEHTTALAAIKSQTEATELPESQAGTEVISSETDPQIVPDGNESQSPITQPDATTAVRLFVTHAPFNCPPCNALDAAEQHGDLAGFDVIHSDGFDGITGYPAIRFEDATSPTGWRVRYGWSGEQLVWLRKNLLPAKENLSPGVTRSENVSTNQSLAYMSHAEMKALHDSLHGGGFSWSLPGGTEDSLAEHLRNTHGVPVNELDQNYRASAINSPRVYLRSATRRKGDNWRSRTAYRISCPSGRSS